MKLLPIGISDFKTIIEQNYCYVDKTLLIKELIEDAGKVILIPRPRRFGKTLNLSMLKYFFEKTNTDNSYLFHNLEIWKYPKFQSLQGNYPIIYLTFKDVKDNNWEFAYKRIISEISEEFTRHFDAIKNILENSILEEYVKIVNREASYSTYSHSLFFLSQILHKHYKTKVIILIDEYDTPIISGYNNNYYNEMIDFMRSLYSSALKDNTNLERGLLTGILRTAKNGIFSELNNLEISSPILSINFQDKFGFTNKEVEQLMNDQDVSHIFKDAQEWYKGYIFGETIIYNPWSIISFVSHKGSIELYWVDTSNNQLIKHLLILSNESVKEKFELLLTDKPIIEEIDYEPKEDLFFLIQTIQNNLEKTEKVIFPIIEKNAQATWNLLLFTGYLTNTKLELKDGKKYCTLAIPNKELKIFFINFLRNIFEQSLGDTKIKYLLKSLSTGNVDDFWELLEEFINKTMNMFDLPKNKAEKSHHLFALCLLATFDDIYEVKSNRESGLGRYDIMLIPKNKSDLGIIIEFKKISVSKKIKETLESAAQNALKQIEDKKYAQEFQSRGINQVKALGIAFRGKEILVLSQDLSQK